MPEELFAQWLAARGGSCTQDFEAFLRTHAVHEQALRDLHAHWERVEGPWRRAGLGSSLSQRLAVRFGEEIEPAISLHAKRSRGGPPDR